MWCAVQAKQDSIPHNLYLQRCQRIVCFQRFSPTLLQTNTLEVVAIIMMGDPSHVPNLPQDVGNSTRNGIFIRNNTAACGTSAAITQTYCNADDEFCDSGKSLPVHLSYVQAFGTQAAKFIVDKVGGNNTTKA